LKVTFPHMGNLHIPIRALFEGVGLEVVLPPPTGQQTINLGVKYSPEVACFPLKCNMGNFIEAHERGADTIIMAGGVGPCRFGYYAQVEREILHDLGLGYDMVVLEPPRGHIGELWAKIRRLTNRAPWGVVWRAIKLTWAKLSALDDLERLSFDVRCHERRRGLTTRVFRTACDAIDAASTPQEVRAAAGRGARALERVRDPQAMRRSDPPIHVGIVGEIFMVLEPAANLNVAERLGHLGARVERSIMLSDWIRANLFLDALRLRRRADPVKEAAAPYLGHFVGGEGRDTVGNTALLAERGVDGVVHVMPFTCMPEIVAQTILPRVSRDLGIPVLTLVMDEHAAEAGLQTRLEAFCDLLRRRDRVKTARRGLRLVAGGST